MTVASTTEITASYGEMQRRSILQAVMRAQQVWNSLSTADLSASWLRGAGSSLVNVVAAAQLLAASTGQAYVDAMVAADGLRSNYETGADTVNYRQLSGTAADGRALDSLLYLPIIHTKQMLAGGLTLQESMLGGLSSLTRIVSSEVADAGRGAASVSMVANRTVTGYVRCVRATACARCAILAGRWYRYNADFQRHKHCFPAGVVVSGPETLAATRRWYEGELVVITTASGQELPATGNHPILTRRGWVAANLLQEGDEVVRSLGREGATPLVVPDHQQVPSRIEDVWTAESVAGVLRGVPTTTEDFHGDGGHGEVDVVGANRLLWSEGEPALMQQFSEQALALGLLDPLSILLSTKGSDFEGVARYGFASHGFMRGLGELGLLLGRELRHSQTVGLGSVPQVDSSLLEMASYYGTHDTVAPGYGLLALAGLVGSEDFLLGQGNDLPRWDATGLPGSVEGRLRDASVGKDLLNRLSGQVELDRVVDVRKSNWSGHVYSLNSTEGWFNANGLIVSNCQCYGSPSTKARPGRPQSPMGFFNGLSTAEQNRRFGRGGAEAIRNGGDIYQVVNAHRGVTTLDAYGRKVAATLEGTTKRGQFYQQMRRETERRTGQRFARTGADVEQGLPRFRLQTPRLMPSEILELAESRDELIKLLKRFGYLG